MRVHLIAVGRLRASAEKDLTSDYLDRFEKAGRAMGLGPVNVVEVEAKKSGMAEEAILLERAIPKGSLIVTLDERGKVMTSPDFAKMIGDIRDQGQSDLVFIIGGADGIDPNLRSKAHRSLSFGKMVWPHLLARVMLSEQLYRAVTILAGGPYHRT